MARNGSGTYTLPEAAFVNGTVIDEVAMNSNFSDIETEITNSVDKDGQTTWTGNMNAGSKKITNMADGSAATDSCTLGQTTGGGRAPAMYAATVGGTVDAITLTPTDTLGSYAVGTGYIFISAGANTGAVTVNVSGLGAVALKKAGGSALTGGELPAAGGIVHIVHDGTDFELVNAAIKDVAFLAEVDATQSISSSADSTITFDNEVYDTGGDYDNTTYTFTAPVTGIYQFNVSLHTSGGVSVADQDIFIGKLTLSTGAEYPVNYVCPRANTAQGFSFSVTVQMTAADTALVEMSRPVGTGTWKTHNTLANACTFSGFLIK